VAATYTYDGLDRLTRLKDAKGNSVIADNQYSYNTASDITQNIDQSGTHGYGYDAIDRLTSATYTGTPNETYAYDGVGNRTSSHKSATYGYQLFNRLVTTSSASYIYNNNGNMISKTDATGTTQFVWDFENRLTQVVTPSSGSVSTSTTGSAVASKERRRVACQPISSMTARTWLKTSTAMGRQSNT
jgi:YD repeat-containing protein